MSVTGRVDFTGIENAGLDFSQLEDYINDEEDPNESIYFSDNLVTSDLKLPDSPRSAGKVSEGQLSLGQGRLFSQSNGPAVHHNRVSSVTLSVNGASNRSSIQINQTIANNNSETNNVHHLSSTLNANHSHQHHQQQHQQQIIHHHQQPIGHHQPSAHHQQTISLYDNKSHHHPHHLPESPPDSGSEPPYSPPNDDSNRIINNQGNLGTTPSSTTSSTSITNQQSHATSGEMLQTGSVDNLKHFSHYSNNQLKQLAPNELGLPVPPSHLHLPRNNNLVHLNALHGLNGPIPGHPDDGLLVHHLGPSVLNGPINLQSPSMLPGLSPASSGGHPPHLTSLYTPNDEQYIGPNSVSDCGPEGQGQGPNGSQQQQTKKRKMSESPKNVPNSALVNGNIVHIKQEPGGMSPEPGIGPNGGSIMVSMEDEYGFDYNASTEGPPSVYLDSAYQCIRFQTFQQTAWHTLCDASLKELPVPNYRVDADKGFNFSNADDAFVCQKKNHFQVTVHVQPIGDPHFVKTAECVKKVDNFYLHFYGVKVESPSQTIKIEQSQSDRSKKPFHPVLIELNPEQVSKTTVGRLHFSETTSNNMRKKGKPNPDQRYFYLVVSLCAHVGDQSYPIVSHASERIIVRASNPGQFENDMELSWQKGHTPESIYHAGRVGINTDRPDEPLVVHGNVKVTGHIIQPSDRRAKTNIEEISTREQLKNVSNIRVVRYQFTPEFAQQVGLKEEDINGTGIIAQEVRQILPDAVKETGDVILPTGERIEKLLVVNKERIFMENVGAVKELCKVTDNLETRIDELERMNKKLRRINRFDSIKSILSSSSVASASTVTCISNYSVGQNGKRFSHKLPHAYEPHGRKCSKHSNPEDNQVCTNRFMQSIIMILVFIMAFCLASIVALYILDYPRRHANDLAPSAHHNFDHQFSQQQHTQFVNKSQPSFQHSPSSSSISTLFTESPYSSSSLSSATASMLTKSQSTMNSRPRSDLDRGYTKSDTQYSVDSSAHNVGWSSTSSDQRPTSLPILRPRILGEPSRCSSLRSKVECPIHCCLELKHESESLYNHNLSKTKQSSSSSDDEKIKLDSSEDKSDLTKESEVKIKEPPKDENNSESQHKDVATASTLTASSSTPIATTTISTIKTNYVSLTSSTTQASNSPLGQRSNGVTVPLKLTAINNHVSEEVSSRVAHGRYNVDSSSSSASSSPESASHINNLAADSSPNYTVSGSNNSSNQPIDPIDQAINSKVALSDSFVANNKFAGYNNHHSQSSSSGMIYSKAEDYREKREARDSKSDVVSSQTAGELLVKRARAASESSRLPGSLIESMRLIELNATIGREFCTTWQCVQQSGSLLSYLVPLSKYMSLEYVTFQFSLSTALKVDNCEYKERPSPCRSSDLVPHTYHRPSEHEPIEEINPSFGIPIGLYARSTYVFRILSKDKNIDTPCSLPESELGSSYLEIELTFYRVCDK